MPKSTKSESLAAGQPAGAPGIVKGKRGKGGRPRKFGEPSYPVTITLPESTLRALAEVDPDRATAIVRLAGAARSVAEDSTRLARIVEIGKGRAVIIVASSRALAKIPFLQLIETSPGQFLLALQPGNDFKNLELAVRDELDELPESEQRERKLLSGLLDCFTRTRKGNLGISAEILLVGKMRKRRSKD